MQLHPISFNMSEGRPLKMWNETWRLRIQLRKKVIEKCRKTCNMTISFSTTLYYNSKIACLVVCFRYPDILHFLHCICISDWFKKKECPVQHVITKTRVKQKHSWSLSFICKDHPCLMSTDCDSFPFQNRHNLRKKLSSSYIYSGSV